MWYKKHYAETQNIDILYQDKQGYYQVSISQSEQYLSYLKSSGFVTDKYIGIWAKYFKDKAAHLKENLQKEGPPEVFEYDFVLIAQEPELILNGLDYLTFQVE